MLKWLHMWVAITVIVMIMSPVAQGMAWADAYPDSVDNGDGTRTLVFRPSGGLNNGTDQGGVASGKDANVFSVGSNANANFGASSIFHTFKSNCNEFFAQSYFQWDVSTLPPASDVTSVKLVLYHDILRSYTWPYQISPTTMNVRAVTSPWNEMAVTYNNQPTVASPVLASVSIPTEIWGPVSYVNNPTGTRTAFKGFVTIDITGIYREWRSGTRPNNGIQYSRLESFCENANASYVYSSDQADVAKRPALQISYRAAVLDTTPPLISQALTGTAGANGWYVSDVGVSWSVSDGESAVLSTSGCGPAAVTADTAGEVFTCTATSEGGTSSQSVTVRRDGTPPSITGFPSPLANGNGWNNTDVTVSFTCSDGVSGVASCPGPVTVSAEGAGQSVSRTAVDSAGNSAGATVGGINIDRTAPVVVYSGNAGSYSVDQQVDISCSAVDHLSGIASSTCRNISGPAYVFSVGTNTNSATATDLAGNAGGSTATFTVAVTPAGLSSLTARFVTQTGLLKSLQAKLNAAAAAFRGNGNAKAGALSAFTNEVQAQTGKALTADQATILIGLARAL